MSREDLQLEAVTCFIEAQRGTVILPTGAGKTKVGIMAIQAVKPASVLIVTSKINLISQWKEEALKWGYTEPIEVLCINSAYKQRRKVELLIVDECHKTLSDVFYAMYSNIEYDKLLCLTATVPHRVEYMKRLNTVAPIVYSKTINDVLDIGAVSPFEVYNVAVHLDKSVIGKFKAFNEMFSKGLILINIHKRGTKYDKETAFDIAKILSKSKEDTPLVKACRQFWSGMTLRKKVLYENPAKISAVISIVKRQLGKGIIFTKSIKFAEEISKNFPCRIYHSKMTKLERVKVLEDFQANKFKILISVDALNEGLNVPDVDYAISVSGSSTELEQIQRLGRIVRKKEKLAKFYNLYVPATQEETWVKKRSQTLNPQWITLKDV